MLLTTCAGLYIKFGLTPTTHQLVQLIYGHKSLQTIIVWLLTKPFSIDLGNQDIIHDDIPDDIQDDTQDDI